MPRAWWVLLGLLMWLTDGCTTPAQWVEQQSRAESLTQLISPGPRAPAPAPPPPPVVVPQAAPSSPLTPEPPPSEVPFPRESVKPSAPPVVAEPSAPPSKSPSEPVQPPGPPVAELPLPPPPPVAAHPATPSSPQTLEPAAPSPESPSGEAPRPRESVKPPAPPTLPAGPPPAEPAPAAPPVVTKPLDPLATLVTLRGAGVPLADVLTRIARATGLVLAVEPEVPLQALVDVDAVGRSARDTLRQLTAPLDLSVTVDPPGTLVIAAFQTRTWTLSLPPAESNWEQTITNLSVTGPTSGTGGDTGATGGLGGRGGGGSGGGGTNQSGSTVGGNVQLGSAVTLTQKGTRLSYWQDVEDTLKRVVRREGWYAINRLGSSVTVRERPSRLADLDRYFRQIEQEVSRQVQVEVKVLEVEFTAQDALGIDWQRVFSGLLDSGRGKLSVSFKNTPEFIAGAAPPISLLLKGGSEELVLKALGQQGRVRTLSQPKLLIANNHAAVIQVGELRSFLATTQTTLAAVSGASQTAASLGSVQDGVILGLTPRIHGTDVVLTVTPVLTRIEQIRKISLGGGNQIEAPDLNNRALSTTVRVPTGQIAVLGGLLDEQRVVREAGLPWLRQIPVLGWLLLGFHDARARRSEIVITLTPTILAPPPGPAVPGPAPGSPPS